MVEYQQLGVETLCTSAVFFYPPQHLVVKLPAGKRVLILNGPHRDTEAVLEGIDEKNFSATLTLDSVSISTASGCIYIHIHL